MTKPKTIKFKNSPIVDTLILRIEVTDKERLDFHNAFHQGPLIMKIKGRDYKVVHAHPTNPHDKGILKLTVK